MNTPTQFSKVGNRAPVPRDKGIVGEIVDNLEAAPEQFVAASPEATPQS